MTLNTWQTWDALNGGWWANNGTAAAGPGTDVKPLTAIIAAQPNARIINTGSLGGVRVIAGGGGPGDWGGFIGNVDNVTIDTVATAPTTFDFEAAPTSVWVNNDWVEQSNTSGGTPGVVEPGDLVMSNGSTDNTVTGKLLGYDAFSTINDALTAVADGGTIHVLAGTYTEALAIAKQVTIEGQSDTGAGVVTIDAGGGFTGIDVQGVVTISGVKLTNFFSTGILVSSTGNLLLSSSTVTGGLNAISVNGGTLDMDHTIIQNVAVFGVQVGGGGSANIETSEVSGLGSTAAGVIVSTGTAFIDNSIITSSNRGVLVSTGGTATIHGSKLTNNTIGNVVNGTANTVDASGNRWDTNVDTTIATTLVGPVDFTPYLDSATDLDGGARGFMGDLSHVHVTKQGGQAGGSGRVQEGVAEVLNGGIVDVHAGIYTEKVSISSRTGITLQGAGYGTTSIVGPHASASNSATIDIVGSSGIVVDGFTITRDGNNATEWATNNMVYGVRFESASNGNTLQNNLITGNRTGIDLRGLSSNNTIQDNRIDGNRTGVIIWDLSNNNLIQRNEITNNWTSGVLFFDTSNEATGNVITNNNISGNWYTQVEDRRSVGAMRDLSGNWFGSNVITVTAAEGGEPGYASLIPAIYGGAGPNSTPPGTPRPFLISGSGSYKVDYTPWLDSGADSNSGLGFNGDFSILHVDDNSPQSGTTGRITEGLNRLDDSSLGGGTLILHAGTYGENVDTSSKVVTLVPGTSPGQIILNGDLALDNNDTLEIELDGTNTLTEYDNFIVNGTVALGGATLVAVRNFSAFPGDEFMLINNDSNDPVNGIFAGLNDGDVITLAGIPFTINYDGGDGNDVTLTVENPNRRFGLTTRGSRERMTSGGGPGIQLGDTVDLIPALANARDWARSLATTRLTQFRTAIDAVTSVAL